MPLMIAFGEPFFDLMLFYYSDLFAARRSLKSEIFPRSLEKVNVSLYFAKKARMDRDFSSKGRKK